jgi:hypothetical protein
MALCGLMVTTTPFFPVNSVSLSLSFLLCVSLCSLHLFTLRSML